MIKFITYFEFRVAFVALDDALGLDLQLVLLHLGAIDAQFANSVPGFGSAIKIVDGVVNAQFVRAAAEDFFRDDASGNDSFDFQFVGHLARLGDVGQVDVDGRLVGIGSGNFDLQRVIAIGNLSAEFTVGGQRIGAALNVQVGPEFKKKSIRNCQI